MSSELALRVEGLSKRFPAHHGKKARTLRDKLASFALDAGDGASKYAFEDVSFELRRGEALGIIGRNGAGKSSLLRVLARITEPSSGRAEIYGRVASILDVGAGFHSELSGRENVYLNGAILGMSRAEVRSKFDAIVSFAELEASIDAPVKTYSAGMSLRLAFAVAAHLDSDLLLLDEVIAVGDARFARRCLARITELIRDGRAVILVSHQLELVRRFCSKTLYLEDGRVALFGETNAVVERYLLDAIGHDARVAFDPADELGDGVSLLLLEVVGSDDEPRASFASSEMIRFRAHFDSASETELRASLVFVASSFEELGAIAIPEGLQLPKGKSTLEAVIEAQTLFPGEYGLEFVASADAMREPLRASRSLRLSIASDLGDERHHGGVRIPMRSVSISASR